MMNQERRKPIEPCEPKIINVHGNDPAQNELIREFVHDAITSTKEIAVPLQEHKDRYTEKALNRVFRDTNEVFDADEVLENHPEEAIMLRDDLTEQERTLLMQSLVGNVALRTIATEQGYSYSKTRVIFEEAQSKVYTKINQSLAETTPQEKVNNWMASLDQNNPVGASDISFTKNQLPNLFITQETSQGKAQTNFTIKIDKYDPERIDNLRNSGLLGVFDDIKSIKNRGNLMLRLSIPGADISPIQMRTVAAIDYLLNAPQKPKLHNKIFNQNNNKSINHTKNEFLSTNQKKKVSLWLKDNLTNQELTIAQNIYSIGSDKSRNISMHSSTARSHISNMSRKIGLTSAQIGILMIETGMLKAEKSLNKKIDSAKKKTLSPQQKTCLQLVAEGSEYKEIADELDIKESTVRQHLHAAYKELNGHNKTNKLKACLIGYASGHIKMPDNIKKLINTIDNTD